ncbi:hypothetical protein GCM10009733_112190 [Nonomuraea maheshkhaliensis]|uniref:DUF4241 domain-containing protein n=1 Tax=Nonomuraea maheshkhaliensis TaxID=419590 RepID=A0ABP4U7V2_9ACTN
MPIPPADSSTIFKEGTRYQWPNGDILRIELREAGALQLPTGNLVARDNSIGGLDPEDDTQAFAVKVMSGSYPVVLAIVNWEKSPHARQRVAAAKVMISQVEATSWEMALRPGQRIADLAPDSVYGFPVDSGQGCYLDASLLSFLQASQRDEVQLDAARDEVMENCHAELIDPKTGGNIILFDCGMGDGLYPTWIGRSAAGEIVCFATDLELLSHSLGTLPQV